VTDMEPNFVRIRPGRLDDVEGAHHCVGVVAQERAYIGFLDPPPIEDSRRYWTGVIESKHPWMLAVQDHRVVGWCEVAQIERPIFNHVGVLGMGLLPDYREKGIGQRLIAEVLRASRACGLERVELAVFADNMRARRLYEKFGFIVEGVRPRRAKIDGRYIDEVLMSLTFSA